MIYYFLYELLYNHFKDGESYLIKALNVFQYVTFRTAYATITALLISLLFGGRFIGALRRWNIGQQIREEGPQAHMAKRGTPTMGGMLIVGSVVIDFALGASVEPVRLDHHRGDALVRGDRFADDYAKMARQRSLGLTGRQKLLAQLLIAAAVWECSFFYQVFRGGLFVECEYSVFRRQRYRSIGLPRLDRFFICSSSPSC